MNLNLSICLHYLCICSILFLKLGTYFWSLVRYFEMLLLMSLGTCPFKWLREAFNNSRTVWEIVGSCGAVLLPCVADMFYICFNISSACLVLAQLWWVASCTPSPPYFKGRHRHNSAFLPQNSETVEVHSLGPGMQPGRTEELTLPQGQRSTMEDGNWQLNAVLGGQVKHVFCVAPQCH